MFHLSHRLHHVHHGAAGPFRDPVQTLHRHLIQALSVGVLLLAVNAAVVIFFH